MLQPRGSIAIPPHTPTEFDHGDVQLTSGRIFVAHTAADTVEVLDGAGMTHLATLPGCPEGSGIICAQGPGLVFAAARGAGKVFVIQASSSTVVGELGVGPRPNGLAWDPDHQHLLVADVQENTARLLDPSRDPADATLATVALPGRPRWAAYDPQAQRFLVNIREPACVAVLAAETATLLTQWPVSVSGPHGLDLDLASGRALVACDGGAVVALDLASGRELAQAPIAGGPDAIWFDPQRRLLYVAIAEPGLVDVVDTAAMVVAQQVETERDAHTSAFDAARQRLYVFLPSSCRAAVYEEV
jgi:DNA-binding beta-propeller fold protein YncE